MDVVDGYSERIGKVRVLNPMIRQIWGSESSAHPCPTIALPHGQHSLFFEFILFSLSFQHFLDRFVFLKMRFPMATVLTCCLIAALVSTSFANQHPKCSKKNKTCPQGYECKKVVVAVFKAPFRKFSCVPKTIE